MAAHKWSTVPRASSAQRQRWRQIEVQTSSSLSPPSSPSFQSFLPAMSSAMASALRRFQSFRQNLRPPPLLRSSRLRRSKSCVCVVIEARAIHRKRADGSLVKEEPPPCQQWVTTPVQLNTVAQGALESGVAIFPGQCSLTNLKKFLVYDI